MALVSPGVEVDLNDNSAYVSGTAASIPLFFIATADEKLQPDGITPALGTYEYGVMRTVTSVQQLLQLYGTPRFLTDSAGNPQHGDARNEYGLDALVKALQVASTAYVIRANVNLDDNLTDLQTMWTNKIQDAASALSTAVAAYISQYNTQNNLIPADSGYKQTVDASEMTQLCDTVLATVFSAYSFSSQQFQNAFLQDHDSPYPGYQDVLFNTTGGFLQLSDATGLVPTTEYGADVEIVTSDGTQTFNISLLGSQAVTFGALINYLNAQFGTAGSSQLLNGILRITSSLAGVTSAVNITSDGPSGMSPLFGSLNLYTGLDTPVPGVGSGALNIYDPTYTTIIGSYDGLDYLINNWTSGNIIPDEFTPSEAQGLLLVAASEFEGTKEFLNYTALGANDAARRAAIVKQLNALINNNTVVTQEIYQFNIMACPGYFEVVPALSTLAETLREEVFVVGETPFNLAPTGPNGITVWASTPARSQTYMNAYWYPHGLSTNTDGSVIMSTAGSTAVRTLLYNDSVAQVYWAPYGVNRGQCPQLTDLGYVQGTLGTATTWVEDLIDQGTRDVLFQFPTSINPISYIPGRGIIVMGQVTSSPSQTAMDRINVVRLVALIRRQIRQVLFAYLGEPNDSITWNNVKYVCDSFMNTLVARRGVYDFLTVCDATNNTAATIDANELYVGIYFSPTKSVDFIYVELNLENTGANLSADASAASAGSTTTP
jgi:hypothetical protein